MKILIRLGLVLLSPYLLVVYWQNNLREIENIHADLELNFE
jgi:hypothetical protein